jgi:hypothetical protein
MNKKTHMLIPYFFKIHVNIILPTVTRFSNFSLFFIFSNYNFICIYFSLLCYISSPSIWPFYVYTTTGYKGFKLGPLRIWDASQIIHHRLQCPARIHIILYNWWIRFKDFTMATMKISLLGCHIMQFHVTCHSKWCHTHYYSQNSQETEIKKNCDQSVKMPPQS